MKIGIMELLILILAAVAVIGAYWLAFSRLYKSPLSPSEKAGWTFVIVFFPLLGSAAFLFYVNYYLRRENPS